MKHESDDPSAVVLSISLYDTLLMAYQPGFGMNMDRTWRRFFGIAPREATAWMAYPGCWTCGSILYLTTSNQWSRNTYKKEFTCQNQSLSV